MMKKLTQIMTLCLISSVSFAASEFDDIVANLDKAKLLGLSLKQVNPLIEKAKKIKDARLKEIFVDDFKEIKFGKKQLDLETKIQNRLEIYESEKFKQLDLKSYAQKDAFRKAIKNAKHKAANEKGFKLTKDNVNASLFFFNEVKDLLKEGVLGQSIDVSKQTPIQLARHLEELNIEAIYLAHKVAKMEKNKVLKEDVIFKVNELPTISLENQEDDTLRTIRRFGFEGITCLNFNSKIIEALLSDQFDAGKGNANRVKNAKAFLLDVAETTFLKFKGNFIEQTKSEFLEFLKTRVSSQGFLLDTAEFPYNPLLPHTKEHTSFAASLLLNQLFSYVDFSAYDGKDTREISLQTGFDIIEDASVQTEALTNHEISMQTMFDIEDASIQTEILINPEASIQTEVLINPEASIQTEILINPEASIQTEVLINPEASIQTETLINPEASIQTEVLINPEASIQTEVFDSEDTVFKKSIKTLFEDGIIEGDSSTNEGILSVLSTMGGKISGLEAIIAKKK